MKPGYFRGVQTEDKSPKVDSDLDKSAKHLLISFWYEGDIDILRSVKTILDNYLERNNNIVSCQDSGYKQKIVVLDLFVEELLLPATNENHKRSFCLQRILNKLHRINSTYLHKTVLASCDSEVVKVVSTATNIPSIDQIKEWHEISANTEMQRIDFTKYREEVEKKLNIVYHSNKLIVIENGNLIMSQGVNQHLNDFIDKGRLSNIPSPSTDELVYWIICHPNDWLSLPIILKNKDDMPSYEHLWIKYEIKPEEKEQYMPKGLVLGYYTREDEDDVKGPHIVLCPENIEEEAKSQNIHLDVLYSMVLIHEFAHAFMDQLFDFTLEYNDDNKSYDFALKEVLNASKSISAVAMEESLANRITLEWFKKFDEKNYSVAEHFIKY